MLALLEVSLVDFWSTKRRSNSLVGIAILAERDMPNCNCIDDNYHKWHGNRKAIDGIGTIIFVSSLLE